MGLFTACLRISTYEQSECSYGTCMHHPAGGARMAGFAGRTEDCVGVRGILLTDGADQPRVAVVNCACHPCGRKFTDLIGSG